MITLYREGDSPVSDAIKERLEELVLAHRVVDVCALDEPERTLPSLEEGDDVYIGDEIEVFLARRSNRLHISRRMSADACFLDPDDPEHCI